MLRAVLIVVGVLVVAVGSGALVFVVGIRTKSPRILGFLRRFNRTFTNKLQRRSAGRAGSSASLVRHRGRSSGRDYETPVVAFAVDGGFLISLPYGPSTDWLKNVLAAGSAVLVTDGHTHTVDHPVVVSTDDKDQLPASEQRTGRWFRINHCLRLHLAEPDDATGATSD